LRRHSSAVREPLQPLQTGLEVVEDVRRLLACEVELLRVFGGPLEHGRGLLGLASRQIAGAEVAEKDPRPRMIGDRAG
jgi:hypothetical protein